MAPRNTRKYLALPVHGPASYSSTLIEKGMSEFPVHSIIWWHTSLNDVGGVLYTCPVTSDPCV